MKRLTLAALAAATALSGCATTRDGFESPTVPLPAAYAHAPAEATSAPAVGAAWWEAFGDDRLTALVQRVLARNNDLAAAALLVRRARFQAKLAEDNALPHASGEASGSTTADGRAADSFSATLGVSYQVDLFGKLGAERDVARWEARATAQDLEATRLSLIGSTLSLYWQLAELNERIALAEESLVQARRILALVEVQRQAGAVSAIEVNEARQSLANQEASLTTARQSRVETRAALALLLGETSWSEGDEPKALPVEAAPWTAPGVPAELLGRRPDLRAAELRLRESFSSVQAARASFYPNITLTGSAGGVSTDLRTLLDNPTAALGIGIDLPFLNWNQLGLELKISKVDHERSVILFRQALLEAFADVEKALSQRTQLAEQGERLRAALDAAAVAERLYGVRYRAGAVSLRIYLDAQEQRRTIEQSVVANELAQLQAQATLYLALGGGDA